MAKLNRRRIAAMLTADAEFDVFANRFPFRRGDFD
jgi:hypothetical protein